MAKHGKTLDQNTSNSDIAGDRDAFNNVFYQDDQMDQLMEDTEGLLNDEPDHLQDEEEQ